MLATGALLALPGCKFVPEDPGSEAVVVVDESTASASCEKLGTTRATVLDEVLGVGRSKEKMGRELEKLAKNSAAEKEGNAIAALGPIEEGSRSFALYRCPQSVLDQAGTGTDTGD